MAEIPPTMRSLIAPKKCKPAQYEVTEMATPTITNPRQVLLKMKAAAINTGDTQMASGMMDIIHKETYPLKIGLEGSGVVAAVGSDVKTLKVGDEVYGFNLDKPISNSPPQGFASEYALSEERFLIIKPPHVTFEEAASYIGLVVTAYQTFRRGLQFRGEDSLEGKTVYVPGALSASGALAIQVARNVYGAKKIISTVSTPKMDLVEKYLGEGMVDQLIDYQTQDVRDVIPKGSIDLMFNTQWNTMNPAIPLLNQQTGTIVSITGVPRKEYIREFMGDTFPVWLGWLLDIVQLYYKWKLWGTQIKYEMVSGSPNVREDMEKAGEWVAQGKVKAVMTVVDLGDVEEVRAACERVMSGKGGLGKLVIRIA
ncbi:Fc.00g023120.m01.CDS01 [Cosmosporella sp. VM-42]